MMRNFIFQLKSIVLILIIGLISNQSKAQVTITIGSGTSTSSYLPLYYLYDYNYTQTIYSAAELNLGGATGSGFITKIRWKPTAAVSTSNWKDLVVYLGNTTQNGFASTANYIPIGSLTQVFNGQLPANTVANQWLEITLAPTFLWDGISNLVVAVDENTSGWGNSPNWAGFTAPVISAGGNRSVYFYQDGTDVLPASPSANTSNTTNSIAQIQFDWIPGTPCSNPINAGATNIVDSVCPNTSFTLGSTGVTVGTGMAYQWQSAPTATGPWTDITGATFANYSHPGITAPSYFRLKSECSGGTPAFTTEKHVTVQSFVNCYCTPTYSYGCSNGAYINNFSTTNAITNISNNGTACASGSLGYSDYTAMQVSASQGMTFNFNVGVGNYSGGVKIWADWNHDGVFDPITELLAASPSTISSGSSFTGTITVPATALGGLTRLRVRVVEGSTVFTPCDNFSYGETEDYIINVTAMPTCTTLSWPASFNAIALPKTLCVSGNSNLSINTNLPVGTGVSTQWQSSTNGITWTDITGATNPTYNATGINATTYFRLQAKCNNTVIISSFPDTVTVTNPGTITTNGASRCGPGSVVLTGTSSIPGNTVAWYTTPTGGVPIATGTSFTTPYLPNTTTYYGASQGGSVAMPPTWLGTGTANSSTPNPYYTTYWGIKNQFLIRASELQALGLTAGTIQSIAFQATGSFSLNLTNFNIAMKQTTATAATTTWETGLTTVYSNPSYTPVFGTNTHLFTTPFAWDGSSNIIIETCFNNSTWSGGFSIVGTTLSYSASTYGYADNATVCSGPANTYTSNFRPNIQFDINSACGSPRVATVATITQGSSITKTAPQVVCNNAVAAINVTLPTNGQYVPYKFYPTTNLYTNAAATTPYTGGAATSVYFKSGTSGQHTVYALGGDTTSTASVCSRADTFNIWVQPANNTIEAKPDTICVSDTSKMTLITDTNFYAGSIQWQQSTNGTSYTNIPGANGVSYTSPVLSSDRYFRAIISAGANTCYSVDKTILVSTPAVLSVQDSSHCGPGSVTLNATPSTNSSIKWYTSPSGGLSIHTGNTFNTPNITTTTTYYATAGTGGSPSPPTWVGNGTATATGSPNPFYTLYYGLKNQYLITAAEMNAVGLTAGLITNLAFDVVSNTGLPLEGLYISMKNTSVSNLTTAWETGLTTVYTHPATSFIPTANSTNDFLFQTPFSWDGSSNVLIEVCFNNTNWSSGHSVKYTTSLGFNATHYYQADNTTVCTTPLTGSVLNSRPNMRFTIIGGCEAPRQPVIATINPLPLVDLGPDLDTCTDLSFGVTLDAGPQPNNATYLWDNGATTSTRNFNQSGTYYVEVTNSYGCVGMDTINASIRYYPIVDLSANGTNMCQGGVKTLDAGPGGENGGSYYWNTGATSRTISVTASGSYIAYVTSPDGCLTIDTVNIIVNGHIPETDGITSLALAPLEFKFNVVNPQYAINYVWDFGDGTPPVNQPNNPTVSHIFPGNGNYWVKVTTHSICGETTDSLQVSIFGVGINNVDNQTNIRIYPNPTDGQIVNLETDGAINISELSIFNLIGQKIYENKKMEKKSGKYQIQLSSHLPAGIYNIKINTDKGIVNRKLEILK
ncbi:MAG TPA: GEVED domain-containing protein [Edaphocola sp.]|nr:GEVED domain-containing protein [Edaphocola sp.]